MKRRAFTLIEILVVVAIIALLAAILFPAFSRARESGRAIACTSNLKQIGMALNMYSEDYNGLHPIAGAAIKWDEIDSATQNGPWMQQLQPYLKSKQVFRCPSDSDSSTPTFWDRARLILPSRPTLLPQPIRVALNMRRLSWLAGMLFRAITAFPSPMLIRTTTRKTASAAMKMGRRPWSGGAIITDKIFSSPMRM